MSPRTSITSRGRGYFRRGVDRAPRSQGRAGRTTSNGPGWKSARARKGRAVELVQAALKGDEEARGEIEALALGSPSAFPAGFGPAIADARFDRAILAELAASLSPAA